MKTPEEYRKDYANLNWSLLKLIEIVQIDAYNQAIDDLSKGDLLVDKTKNSLKFKK